MMDAGTCSGEPASKVNAGWLEGGSVVAERGSPSVSEIGSAKTRTLDSGLDYGLSLVPR